MHNHYKVILLSHITMNYLQSITYLQSLGYNSGNNQFYLIHYNYLVQTDKVQ